MSAAMQLYYSTTSPFARKCLMVAREAGIIDHFTLVPTNTGFGSDGLAAVNPLAKVPALVLDGGEILYDSPVICEYLDAQQDGIPLFPPAGGARWLALRRQALADGLQDATVQLRVEGMRPEASRWPDWIDHQTRKITGALDALEGEVETFPATPTIGEIAIFCALTYLDLRAPSLNWRQDHPALADWFDIFAARPSAMATEFVEK
ncbi:MAG: glutathione S-transferase family protein [Magnetospiraceae bacterium]